jgi:hypothetical protein
MRFSLLKPYHFTIWNVRYVAFANNGYKMMLAVRMDFDVLLNEHLGIPKFVENNFISGLLSGLNPKASLTYILATRIGVPWRTIIG